MTREHKLSLIIGFAVLLVLGVLVGDLFSKAHGAHLPGDGQLGSDAAIAFHDTMTPSNPMNPAGPSNPAGSGGAADSGTRVAVGPGAGDAAGGGAMGSAGGTSGGGAVRTPTEFVNGRSVPGTGLPTGDSLLQTTQGPSGVNGGQGGVTLGGGVMPLPAGGSSPTNAGSTNTGQPTSGSGTQLRPQLPADPGVNTPGNPGRGPANPGGGAGSGTGMGGTQVARGVTPVDPKIAGLPVSTGVEKKYPIASGDSMNKIAQKFYGDGALAQKLADYNKGRVASASKIHVGVTLLIPPKDVLLGKARLSPESAGTNQVAGATGGTGLTGSLPIRTTGAGVSPSSTGTESRVIHAPGGASAGSGNDSRATASGSGARTYTVKKGDTLQSIAAATLGTSKRWEEILSLNSSVIDDEDSLRPGMVLKLPTATVAHAAHV